MNLNSHRRWLLISLFLALALGFLILHLSRTEPFGAVLGRTTLAGQMTKGSPPAVRRLSLFFNGYQISISPSSSVEMITQEGIRHRLNVTGWEVQEDSFVITLKYGVTLSITTSQETVVSLQAGIPRTLPPIESLLFPLSPQEGYQLLKEEDSWSVGNSQGTYRLLLPSASGWDLDSGYLALKAETPQDMLFVTENAQEDKALSLEEWYAQGLQEDGQGLTSWMEKAQAGWEERYDPRSGLWQDGEGKVDWSDFLAAGILALALEEDQYSSVLPRVETAAKVNPGKTGILLSPYLGDIQAAGEELRKEVTRRAGDLAQRVQGPGTELFPGQDRLPLLLDAGRERDAVRLLEAVRDFPEGISPPEALARLEILQDAQKLDLDSSQDSSLRQRLIQEVLAPRILWRQEGLWLFGEKNNVDMFQTLLAARLILDEAASSPGDLFLAAGRQMLVSALRYADDEGILPRKLLFQGQQAISPQGQMLPEEISSSLIPMDFFPRRISLSQEYAPGTWLWTTAGGVNFESSTEEINLTMDFPTGETHYLVLHNIEPFTQVYLHDIHWGSDFRFQNYSEGWLYDKENKTLFLKLRHRRQRETVRILYYYPQEEVVEEEEAEAEAEETEEAQDQTPPDESTETPEEIKSTEETEVIRESPATEDSRDFQNF